MCLWNYVINTLLICEFLGFLSEEIVVSILLGCDAACLGN